MWGMSINQTLLGGQNGQSLLGLEASGAWRLWGVRWAPTSPFWPCPTLNIARFPVHESLLGWWLKTSGYLICFGSCCLCNRPWCSLLLCPTEWHEEPVLPGGHQLLCHLLARPCSAHHYSLLRATSRPWVLPARQFQPSTTVVSMFFLIGMSEGWWRPQVGSGLKFAVTNSAAWELALWSILCHRGRKKKKSIYSSCKSLFFPLDQCTHPHSTSVGVLSQIKSSKWLNGKNNNVSMHPYRFSSILWF